MNSLFTVDESALQKARHGWKFIEWIERCVGTSSSMNLQDTFTLDGGS